MNPFKKSDHYLAHYTTFELEKLLEANADCVILLPVGSVEPHGPHLSLQTDTLISVCTAEASIVKLQNEQIKALIAPAIPYGVTNCAEQFKGAITVDPDALSAFVVSVVSGFLANGFKHCCVINNHLEPEQDQAIRNAVRAINRHDQSLASIASPLTRRWARTLTDEYKKGECHAGQYETSIILAGAPEFVKTEVINELKAVPVSLSEKLNQGISDFLEMGMEEAYAGSPSTASVTEGLKTIDRLATMITTEIVESLAS